MMIICDLLYKDAIKKIELELGLSAITYTYVSLRGKAIFVLHATLAEKRMLRIQRDFPQVAFLTIKRKYKLSNLELFEPKAIEIGEQKISKDYFSIIAGPCTIEADGSLDKIASFLKAKGIHFLRGGAFKPRTSPYEFQGLETYGLELMRKASKKHQLKTVTELMDVRDLDLVMDYADIIQIGARNMQNYALLKELGKIDKPILLKRGMSASINEFLLAADYILMGGNEKVILCERGIKTYETKYRSSLDLTAVSIIKRESHLPIFVDPSHAAGDRHLVADLSKAALAVGADGLLIETHFDPDCAICDGPQSITLEQFSELYDDLKKLAPFFNKKIPNYKNR